MAFLRHATSKLRRPGKQQSAFELDAQQAGVLIVKIIVAVVDPRRKGGAEPIGHRAVDPAAYLASVERVARLPVKRVFPAHHSLDIQPEMLDRVRDAFRELKAAGKLRHGGGKFDYGDFGIWV